MRMPNMGGLETILKVRAEFPAARIVVLTTGGGDYQAIRAFRAGASGYLLKDMLGSELVKTIRLVHEGQRCIPDEIASKLFGSSGEPELTVRELDVLRRAARGLSNKLIAEEMLISEHTVKGYLKNIMTKLHSRSDHLDSKGLLRCLAGLRRIRVPFFGWLCDVFAVLF